ncbi:MAG: hypothetical protein EXR72_00495 [Myxococcales bacterium]|nr:hypothetical protein [Myxococcales bacterium]
MSRLAIALLLCAAAPALGQSPARYDDPGVGYPVDAPAEPVLLIQTLPPPAPRTAGAAFRLSAGLGVRSLYDHGFGGAALGIAVGGFGPHGAWYITTDLFLGASDFMLPTEHFQFGVVFERILGSVRLGGGQQLGVLAVQRATRGKTMAEFTLGAYLTASLDLTRGIRVGYRRRAASSESNVTPYVAARLGADWLPGAAFAADASLAIGIRL